MVFKPVSIGDVAMTFKLDIVSEQRVLCNSRPCYQDCWHTDLVG